MYDQWIEQALRSSFTNLATLCSRDYLFHTRPAMIVDERDELFLANETIDNGSLVGDALLPLDEFGSLEMVFGVGNQL